MTRSGKAIQRKIFASACQRFFGKVDIESCCSDVARAHRKGAGIGKAVQQALGRDVTDKAAIFSLIWNRPTEKPAPKSIPNFKRRSVAIVCRFSVGFPHMSRGGSRCSLFRGTNRAKMRSNLKGIPSAHSFNS